MYYYFIALYTSIHLYTYTSSNKFYCSRFSMNSINIFWRIYEIAVLQLTIHSKWSDKSFKPIIKLLYVNRTKTRKSTLNHKTGNTLKIKVMLNCTMIILWKLLQIDISFWNKITVFLITSLLTLNLKNSNLIHVSRKL